MLVILSLLAAFPPVPEPAAREELAHTDNVTALAWSRDGKRAITGTSKGEIVLWNGQTGAKLATLSGHRKPIRDLSSAGDLLASLDTSGEIILWDLATNKKQRSWSTVESVESIALRPDGKELYGGDPDRCIRCWDTVKGEEKRTFRLGALKEQFRRLVFVDQDRLSLYDLTQERSSMGKSPTIPPDQREKHLDHVPHLAWSGDGKAWALVGETQIVLPASGATLALIPEEGPVVGIGLSPDGKQVVFATAKGVLRVHETDKKVTPLARVDKLGELTSFRLAPDGKRYLATQGDRRVVFRQVPKK
jgi:WD40 repeat protein